MYPGGTRWGKSIQKKVVEQSAQTDVDPNSGCCEHLTRESTGHSTTEQQGRRVSGFMCLDDLVVHFREIKLGGGRFQRFQ